MPLPNDDFSRPVRHAWVRLKPHNYLCRKCGTGKRNTQDRSGEWFATHHRATGEVVTSRYVPECEVGKLTEERLAWLQKRTEARGTEVSDGV
jgi:hypothetical protein